MKTELQALMNDCDAELVDIDSRITTMQALDTGKKYLTQYALIRTCGTIEYVYRSIVADFFSQYGISQIDQYLDQHIRSGSMSATYDNMKKLLKAFDDGWERTFKSNVDAHPECMRIKSSISSLVNNRHLFAHGKAPTATFSDIKQYYSDAKTLVQLFDQAVI